ncbi:hypothetical protein GCM10009850_053640 [Nonomuraea monospora]|uniref:Uncharacterized protein n=1 Tax=Nonomuraea monospora TaxID=568818 RepID=A0ABN3CK94_9ACTN
MEFQARLGIARNLLATRLDTLVAAGVMRRVPYQEPGDRQRHAYEPTEQGLALRPTLVALLEWGDTSPADPQGPSVIVRHRPLETALARATSRSGSSWNAPGCMGSSLPRTSTAHPGQGRASSTRPEAPVPVKDGHLPTAIAVDAARTGIGGVPYGETRAPGRWHTVIMRTPRAKYFNTTGPCGPERHYMLPPTQRLPQARELIEMDRYFVLHAPRQTGKTTTLRTLAAELTAEGDIAALMFSCERAKVAGDDYAATESLLLESLHEAAQRSGWPKKLLPPASWSEVTPGSRFHQALSKWCRRCPRRVVLFIDEIDALQGDSMVSILSQLRDGHNARQDGQPFPASVVLCGLRDVRDYKIASGGAADGYNAASPFNIIRKSLRLGDFTADEIAELYDQHTQATGQEFTKDAVERVFELTQGQPWLVNALADEIITEMRVTGTIATGQVEDAKERLIKARAIHLDSLAVRLREPRVKRVMEPIVAGGPYTERHNSDDLSYARDLGLITLKPPPQVANPIYREVILRVLGDLTEQNIHADPHSFVLPDGRFDLPRLLREFVVFWREHGEVLIRQEGYHEAACQIILMAFLHRLINGGGYLDREYASGTKRLDVLVRWPYPGPDGERLIQREAMELKVWRAGENDPKPDGLAQLDRYLDRLTLTTGVLVIFDRRPDAPPWQERGGFEQATTPSGRQVTLLRV